jgi:ABC-type Zn2+ transport system substrate-binding protein/surface adhesin
LTTSIARYVPTLQHDRTAWASNGPPTFPSVKMITCVNTLLCNFKNCPTSERVRAQEVGEHEEEEEEEEKEEDEEKEEEEEEKEEEEEEEEKEEEEEGVIVACAS